MENLSFLEIIFVILGILQIILFFKIWAMANNIKNIKCLISKPENSEMQVEEYLRDAKLSYINNNKEACTTFLEKAFFTEIKGSGISFKQYKQIFPHRIKEYTSLHEQYGINIPDFSKYENLE